MMALLIRALIVACKWAIVVVAILAVGLGLMAGSDALASGPDDDQSSRGAP